MKKSSIMVTLLAGALVFASCDTDRDDNPVMQTPTEFTLNDIAFGETPIDLAASTSVELVAADQPAYGFPTDVTYGAQISLDQNWNDSASVYTIDGTTKNLVYNASTTEIDKGIMILGKYENDEDLNTSEPMAVYIRMSAKPTNMGDEATIYSNVKKINVYPYFMTLKPAEPDYWFLIGASIGDGKWTDTGSPETYLSLFPLSLVKGGTYDTKTGKGEFESTFYLAEGGEAKIKHYTNSWDFQWGWDGSNAVHNDGGSGNFTPTKGAGFYTIHYNSAAEEMTFTKSEKQDYPTYASIGLIGTLQGSDWDKDFEMMPATAAGANNHMWTAQVTIENEGEVFKFRANQSWDANWGYGTEDGDVNLYGFTTNGGKNIGIEPGQYTIYFNDIDGFFRVVPIGDKQKPEGATE
ncbi:MAG: hypothetical protein ACOYJK_00720 [Prevotella sp.]|jgi:hypothetical protein